MKKLYKIFMSPYSIPLAIYSYHYLYNKIKKEATASDLSPLEVILFVNDYISKLKPEDELLIPIAEANKNFGRIKYLVPALFWYTIIKLFI